jgi:hypothetical protein
MPSTATDAFDARAIDRRSTPKPKNNATTTKRRLRYPTSRRAKKKKTPASSSSSLANPSRDFARPVRSSTRRTSRSFRASSPSHTWLMNQFNSNEINPNKQSRLLVQNKRRRSRRGRVPVVPTLKYSLPSTRAHVSRPTSTSTSMYDERKQSHSKTSSTENAHLQTPARANVETYRG